MNKNIFSSKVALVALVVLGAAGQSHAQKLVYIEASSEFDNGRPATYAYNAIDGKNQTAWCSGDNPKDERLVFTFDRPVKIDSFGIIGSKLKAGESDPRFARAKELVLFDGTNERSVRFSDLPQLQDLTLAPAPKTSRLVLTIKKAYAGEHKSAPVCIGEVVLKSGSKELTGAVVKKSLRGLIPPARKLLHTWVDLLDGTERTFEFHVDGTFRFSYEPLLDGKPFKASGTWRRTSKRLVLKTRGKTYRMKVALGRVDDGNGQSLQLHLTGDAPNPSMVHPMRPRPVRPPLDDDDDDF
ncbi:MAG: discoidin domain-containing protein [Deltaproteobacteria bacterium]|nr:discoidin domain-containing protein [Deltaproteobacteria bacterium]